MNRSGGKKIWEIAELLLSIGIIAATVPLILNWKAYELCFVIAFFLAAVLFIVRAIGELCRERRGSIFTGIMYMAAAVIMVAMLVVSALTMWNGVV